MVKNLIRLTDFTAEEIRRIFHIANELNNGKYTGFLRRKSVVMFFPATSIRTRISFEKGIYLLDGQVILFPTETLDKKEDLKDVCGYLNNWADLVIVRHKDIGVLTKMAEYLKVPLINAMTDVNHPCEMLGDLYALSKRRTDFLNDKYVFCGRKCNIGLAWQEAAKTLGFALSQCCPVGYEMDGIEVFHDMETAVRGKDIICTDSLPASVLSDFQGFQVTKAIMELANPGAVLNPCPPFYRGEEVSADVIESKFFVGYEFKECLLEVQQAVMIYLLEK